VKPKKCPVRKMEKRNSSGALIRRLRTELGWNRETLMTKIQLAGWDIDRSVLVLIENEERPLLDQELKLILNVLGKDWDGIFRK